MRTTFHYAVLTGIFLAALLTECNTQEKSEAPDWNEQIVTILENTSPLKFDREGRLPLFIWSMDPGHLNDEQAENLVRELDERGIGVVCTWKPDDHEETLRDCFPVARAQNKLGLPINVNANPLLYSLFNGEEKTAHISSSGEPYFDESFPAKQKMGCPFAVDHRKSEIRKRVDFYLNRYKKEGLPVGFAVGDWEIDGPLEVNRAYEASSACVRCRKYLGDSFTFDEFQKSMREMRSYLQYYMYSFPVLSAFPDALVGNYAVYPHDGYRYWYDYFEYYVEGQPFVADQEAKYRQWYDDFPATGYTYAMPVVYTWYPIFNWYDFENPDYRWFYNMLLVASNAGKSSPRSVPVVSFVTRNTVWVGTDQNMVEPDPSTIQMSPESYQELLWHMLLRGTNTFYIYSGRGNLASEVRLVHEVYAAAQEYGDFLEHGLPVTFDVPDAPGTVVSGLILDDRVLVRRTDFGTSRDPVEIMAGTSLIEVNYAPGVCQIIEL